MREISAVSDDTLQTLIQQGPAALDAGTRSLIVNELAYALGKQGLDTQEHEKERADLLEFRRPPCG